MSPLQAEDVLSLSAVVQRAVLGQAFGPGPLTPTSQWRRRRASKCQPARTHLRTSQHQLWTVSPQGRQRQGRLSTNVSSPHIRALHQETNNNEWSMLHCITILSSPALALRRSEQLLQSSADISSNQGFAYTVYHARHQCRGLCLCQCL